MSPWRALGNRLRALLQKARLDADMDEEMRTHIEMRAQRNLDAGMDPEEARYAARRQFGPIESIQDACRGERGVGWIEDFLHDVRHGARRLGKDRGFTAVSVLTLALGIGAVVAIFAAADDLLFRPLPYRAPDRLFRLWERDPTRPETARSEVSADDFMAWKAGGSSFEGMAAYYEGRAVLHDGERADELHVQGVTPGFFPMLGIGAFHGRTFAPDDGPAPGTSAPVIISFRLWRSWFGGEPGRRRARGEARLRDGHDHRRHAAGLSLRGPGGRSLASAAPSALEEPGPECGGAIEAGRGAGGGGSAVEPDGATLDGYRGAPA